MEIGMSLNDTHNHYCCPIIVYISGRVCRKESKLHVRGIVYCV